MDDEQPVIGLELEGLLRSFEDFTTNRRHFNYTAMTSPMDVVQRERHLAELSDQIELGAPVPSDVLVFGWDDDNGRASSKVGGLPYRPCKEPWPIASDGSPMEFLAQFNFLQSQDILPSLPAELLLVFVGRRHFEMSEIRFEWRWLVDDIELVSKEEIAPIDRPMVASPVYAVPCRMSDYPDARPLEATVRDDWGYFTRTRASKIGGAPSFFRPPELPMTGEFLCALHTLRHGVHTPWPFLNIEEPLTPQMLGGVGVGGGRGCHDTVMIADEGALYFYLQEEGDIRVFLQSWSCEEFLNVT